MIKRIVFAGALLTACFCSTLRGQTTNAADAATNAVAAATTNAAPADAAPKPDPAGTATGASADAQDASGGHFVVSEPTLSDDDKKVPDKVKAYADAKKAYDDYLAQAKVEPLAVKLSDAVGHNRVAVNFMWTLITGFLVMFMQAGFALVETGFVPRQERRPYHGDEFHDLSHGHARILPLWLRFHVRWFGPHRNNGRLWRFERRIDGQHIRQTLWSARLQGFMLQGVGYDTAAFALFLFQMVFMDTTATIPTGGAA